MRMRNLLLGVLTAGLAHAVAMTASADWDWNWVDFKVDDNVVGTIEVQGPNLGTYKEVRTKTLDYVVWVKGNPEEGSGDSTWTLKLSVWRGGGWKKAYEGKLYEEWAKYKVVQEYYDSPVHLGATRLAPIRRCNDFLKQTSGAAREEFLFKGATLNIDFAYSIYVQVEHPHIQGTIWVPVRIKCLPLNQSPVRATLRAEPAKVQQMGKFLCPMELKLHGYVESRGKFDGKSNFVGPHYLSAFTTLNLKPEGHRNVTGTYKMDWHKMGGLTTAPNAEPKKQKLTFRFNIADTKGKLQESAEQKIEVSCRKVKVNVPTTNDGMAVAPSN